MNIFVSYKQTGIKVKELESNLLFLKKTLEKLGHKTFIYFLDDNSNKKPSYILKKVKEEIKKSDLILCFINDKEKSEGMLLEIGIAYSLSKKIKLLINNKIKNNYYLTYGTSDDIIYFDKVKDIKLNF